VHYICLGDVCDCAMCVCVTCVCTFCLRSCRRVCVRRESNVGTNT